MQTDWPSGSFLPLFINNATFSMKMGDWWSLEFWLCLPHECFQTWDLKQVQDSAILIRITSSPGLDNLDEDGVETVQPRIKRKKEENTWQQTTISWMLLSVTCLLDSSLLSSI
jgi:hypothetical protein